VDSIRESINERDYNKIKPFLSNDFHFKGSETTNSFTTLYAYLNFKQSEEISDIKIDFSKEIKDSLVSIEGQIFFKNYEPERFELQYRAIGERPEIVRMSIPWPHKFPIVTRATYKAEEIAGGNPVENILNLHVWDFSSVDSLSQKGYTIYYEEGLRAEGEQSLVYFHKLDSLLSNRFFIKEIEQENLYLSNRKSTNTIFIGTSTKIPWTMALYETESINRTKLKNKIGSTFSHEIIEGTLVNKYDLSGYEYRWFRDGLSEYIAYEYCKLIAPDEAEKHFIEWRISAASKDRKNGNLLDWRGAGPIKEVDKGKLYGKKFIYEDEVGQYGRAFKFFKDQFENNEDKLVLILKEIKKQDEVSVEIILDIMSDITHKNMKQVISQY
jgi:hypothetical protein